MGNNIKEKQNNPESLLILAAQRRLYSRAKHAAAVQIVFVVILPGILVLFEPLSLLSKPTVAAISLFIAVADTLFINKVKSSVRRRAATVQELFDCRVLELEWPDLKGQKPDWEDVKALAESVDVKDLKDWYPSNIDSLPVYAARIICQRSNCRWDSKLRQYFRSTLLGFAAVVSIAGIVVALRMNLTFSDLILGLIVPLLPIVLWSIRESEDQLDADKRANLLKIVGEEIWNDLLSGTLSPDVASFRSRRFQDELYEHRARSPLVFDFFYRLFRGRFQSQMVYSTEEMVKEVDASKLISR